jgi:hypothetical protein
MAYIPFRLSDDSKDLHLKPLGLASGERELQRGSENTDRDKNKNR